MKRYYPVILILLCVTVACNSNTVEEEKSREITPFGEFIDDWTFNVDPKSGASFDEANFRLWLPEGEEALRAILIILSFSDGSSFGDIRLEEWTNYAKDQKLGLLGVSLKGRDRYANVDLGSGDALIRALDTITFRNNIPEIGKLPFLLCGYSAGGVFAYNFSWFKPERTIAFVSMRAVGSPVSNIINNAPGLMLLAENDFASRNLSLKNLVLTSRAESYLYSYAIEPTYDHFGPLQDSWELSRSFFTTALEKRLKPNSNDLNAISENTGWLGNNDNLAVYAFGEYPDAIKTASWLIDENFASSWKAYQE